ncbi:NUDIX domain-containing protein [Solibacillus isronensis]
MRDGIIYYVFPGGGIEKGETPEEAAKKKHLRNWE